MKKLLTLMLSVTLVATACTAETDSVADVANEDVAATLTELATDAQELVTELDGPEAAGVNDVLSVIAQDTSDIALAATGGDVSDADVDRLVASLGDLQLEIDTARDALDPAVAERLDALRSDIETALDRLDD